MNIETEHTPGSLNDRRAGYPAYRAQLAAMSDRALSAEYAWVLRGTVAMPLGGLARAWPADAVVDRRHSGISSFDDFRYCHRSFTLLLCN